MLIVRVPCSSSEGLHPSERTIRVSTIDGDSEEVGVDQSFVDPDGRHAYFPLVAADQGAYLIEFPVESARGNWRVWVNKERAEIKHDRRTG